MTMRDKHAPECEDHTLARGSPIKAWWWAVESELTDKGGGEVRLCRELMKKDKSSLQKTNFVKNAIFGSDTGRDQRVGKDES